MQGTKNIHDVILSMEKQLTYIRIENWLNQDLFSWQWWLLVVVLLVPWFIWWKFIVEKKRLLEITLFGTIVLIISSYLDAVITEFGLWSYRVWVIPLWPRLITADFTVIPVTLMIIYQYFRTWKYYIIAMFIISFLFAFMGEPFLTWINVYELHGWKHIYSFPIYIAIGILIKYLVQTLISKQAKEPG